MNKPFFSVIVPTFERCRELEDCLDALSNLDYPRDLFEVIIVDDGSSTSPEPIVTRFIQHINVRLIAQQHSGPAAARNRGVREAKGGIIAFTDSDCQIDRDWLNVLAAEFAEAPDVIIGGRTINQLNENFYSSASQLIIDYLYSYHNQETDQPSFFTSNNLALKAVIFYNLGGFDPGFSLPAAEDRDLCDRCVLNGYKLIYEPGAVVYHSHSLNIFSFWMQHFNYGRGAFSFHKARKKRSNLGIKVEPFSFYFDLLKYPLRRAGGFRAIRLVMLLGISQVANAAGFFRMKLDLSR